MITPFYFGSASQQLFGVLHGISTSNSLPVKKAVLLINPFGQEAIRAHRLYRLLGERLARAGAAVLRFDFYGTGDSSGEDHEFSLLRCVEDILLAQQELIARSGCRKVLWLGTRLGATVAAMASRQADAAPDQLFFWDPIARGELYLQQLREREHDWLQRSYGRAVHLLPWASETEILGFALTPPLRQEIESIGPSAFGGVAAKHVTVLASGHQPDASLVCAALQARGLSVQTQTLDEPIEWASEEAMNSALVPSAALPLIERQVELLV